VRAQLGTAKAQGITHKYSPSVSLDVPTKRKLVEKALTLKAGDTFQTVTNTLGQPTTDTDFGDDFHYLDYHIQAWNHEGIASSDAEYLRVRLGPDKRVVSVWIRVDMR
jgi:outer membrane protein assembly factor BamE (lipoprotein component of BamABCDE complex)